MFECSETRTRSRPGQPQGPASTNRNHALSQQRHPLGTRWLNTRACGGVELLLSNSPEPTLSPKGAHSQMMKRSPYLSTAQLESSSSLSERMTPHLRKNNVKKDAK